MSFTDIFENGFADDDRENGTDRPVGLTPLPTSSWPWPTPSSPSGAPASLVATTSPSPSLDQAGSSPVWTGLLKGLNAAADAFATATANGGKNRNAALAKGLDAAAKTINDLNRPLTPARYLRANDAPYGATPPFIGAQTPHPVSWPGPERPYGNVSDSWRKAQRPIGMDSGWGTEGEAIILSAAADQGNPLQPSTPGRFGTAAVGARRQAADAWAASPATSAGQAPSPFGSGQGHPADPPDFRATFPRTLDGPVTPEADDRDPETGAVDLNRLFGRVADRMVYAHTGFLPASYAAWGLPSGGLTPDYLNPATGARVPGDMDADTAHRAVLQATNDQGPASDESANERQPSAPSPDDSPTVQSLRSGDTTMASAQKNAGSTLLKGGDGQEENSLDKKPQSNAIWRPETPPNADTMREQGIEPKRYPGYVEPQPQDIAVLQGAAKRENVPLWYLKNTFFAESSNGTNAAVNWNLKDQDKPFG